MKEFAYNNPNLKNRRKTLRKNQTDAERIVWRCLRNKQVFGLKFFRQFGVGSFTLDFYCPALHLAIEIDGGQHAESGHKIYDERRTDFLKQKNIIVIRFWDNEILRNIDGVLEKITEEISKLK